MVSNCSEHQIELVLKIGHFWNLVKSMKYCSSIKSFKQHCTCLLLQNPLKKWVLIIFFDRRYCHYFYEVCTRLAIRCKIILIPRGNYRDRILRFWRRNFLPDQNFCTQRSAGCSDQSPKLGRALLCKFSPSAFPRKLLLFSWMPTKLKMCDGVEEKHLFLFPIRTLENYLCMKLTSAILIGLTF